MTERHVIPIEVDKLPSIPLTDCGHENFHFELEVCRVVPDEGGSPHTWELVIKASCSSCGTPFRFRGEHAISFTRPTVSIFGETLSAPMEPVPVDEQPPDAP